MPHSMQELSSYQIGMGNEPSAVQWENGILTLVLWGGQGEEDGRGLRQLVGTLVALEPKSWQQPAFPSV